MNEEFETIFMNKLLIILFFLCYPSTAYAYLDPGTTGIILVL